MNNTHLFHKNTPPFLVYDNGGQKVHTHGFMSPVDRVGAWIAEYCKWPGVPARTSRPDVPLPRHRLEPEKSQNEKYTAHGSTVLEMEGNWIKWRNSLSPLLKI